MVPEDDGDLILTRPRAAPAGVVPLARRRTHGAGQGAGSMSNIATLPSNIATLAMLLLRSNLLSVHRLGHARRVTLPLCHIAT